MITLEIPKMKNAEEILRHIICSTTWSLREEEGRDINECYYFDPLLGCPMPCSPYLSSLNDDITIVDLLERFPLDLSPKLRQSPPPWELLLEYERLLASSCALQRTTTTPQQQQPAVVANVICSMAEDIFHLMDTFSTASVEINSLLALLMRCVHHSIQVFFETQNKENESFSQIVGMGLLVAASFLSLPLKEPNACYSGTYLDAEQLVPSLHQQLSLTFAVDTYCDPRLQFCKHRSSSWEKPVLDTHQSAFEIPWAESPVLRRCAASLAQSCSLCLTDPYVSYSIISQMCRAHFYGRLRSTTITTITTSSNKIVITQQQQSILRHPSGVLAAVPNPNGSSPEKPRLSQLVAPLRIFSMLAATTDISVDALPVIYSLLDCWDGKYQTLGGALSMTVAAGKGDCVVLEQALSRAIRACRDPVALTVLSMARCQALLLFVPSDRKLLQMACKEFFHKATSRSGSDRQLLPPMIVGAILPVLSHLCQNANAVEIARDGLHVILSALGSYYPPAEENNSASVTMAGLLMLLMGSWPVAHAYSGQIMSSFLTVIGRANNDSTQQHVSDFAKHCASIALILCGEAGQQVLTTVESEVASLAPACKEIRFQAQMFLTAESYLE
mmetsp:Transcript_592/g.855  ORF Transcript_592/g.855 Transcript_592/m.855 type:complete len:616 (+) Transcript_592:77-1924(+)|eukprot:CAMPEP_0172431994 /NCGR_PEP_ID=MMETSP1064-20121228/60984_1 /TAXON_ID=202472 /ORGANISM="Aulacoseira subarctica , Strain CCAP 1002/5" /LENGTH=615 /DNA_ID=CAMNT_0013179015 /DNA_START=22 /DNA_END=1869 /DNA_ORIENTATION=+